MSAPKYYRFDWLANIAFAGTEKKGKLFAKPVKVLYKVYKDKGTPSLCPYVWTNYEGLANVHPINFKQFSAFVNKGIIPENYTL